MFRIQATNIKTITAFNQACSIKILNCNANFLKKIGFTLFLVCTANSIFAFDKPDPITHANAQPADRQNEDAFLFSLGLFTGLHVAGAVQNENSELTKKLDAALKGELRAIQKGIVSEKQLLEAIKQTLAMSQTVQEKQKDLIAEQNAHRKTLETLSDRELLLKIILDQKIANAQQQLKTAANASSTSAGANNNSSAAAAAASAASAGNSAAQAAPNGAQANNQGSQKKAARKRSKSAPTIIPALH
jgi:hypothetical protein